MNREGRPEHGGRASLMTLRVYTVSRDGAVADERPTVHVRAGDGLPPLLSHVFPPCACPRHRGRS